MAFSKNGTQILLVSEIQAWFHVVRKMRCKIGT